MSVSVLDREGECLVMAVIMWLDHEQYCVIPVCIHTKQLIMSLVYLSELYDYEEGHIVATIRVWWGGKKHDFCLYTQVSWCSGVGETHRRARSLSALPLGCWLCKTLHGNLVCMTVTVLFNFAMVILTDEKQDENIDDHWSPNTLILGTTCETMKKKVLLIPILICIFLWYKAM